MRQQTEVTRDALEKMEKLVKLNDELMTSNTALQTQAAQNFQQVQVQENKVQKLQKDLTFYINKANTLEHALTKSQMHAQAPLQYQGRESHEDSKMSKSMRHRSKNNMSPYRGNGPVE